MSNSGYGLKPDRCYIDLNGISQSRENQKVKYCDL